MNRILIVEDDGDMVELLSIVFRNSGYDVTFSSKALELGAKPLNMLKLQIMVNKYLFK